MKNYGFILLCAILLMASCKKDDSNQDKSDGKGYEVITDDHLSGTVLAVDAFPESIRKVFILNQGKMGSNGASLDILRTKDGNYVCGIFKKMNPDEGAGLGDVGNDIAVLGDEIWIVVNNSGIVDVISARNEREIAAITVPTPRCIAFDEKYAYVTSWAGASYGGSSNPKGRVYRIDIATKKVIDSVEVGHQPEGLAAYGGKLFVANSGGLTLPPDYSYDKDLSIIDTRTFTVSSTLEVAPNLQKVYSDGKGRIYVSTYCDYASINSALYAIDGKEPEEAVLLGEYASITAMHGGTVYCIGNKKELDWTADPEWTSWKCSGGVKSDWNPGFDSSVSPYSIGALSEDLFLIGDAGNYEEPGTVYCYSKGSKLWSVTSGVIPGAYAAW
ncbi:MAG: hypothetical protein IKR69_00275 [Bacteroidales bacterium]|nr:hypothetical protein [Bacteroidales bacterium]